MASNVVRAIGERLLDHRRQRAATVLKHQAVTFPMETHRFIRSDHLEHADVFVYRRQNSLISSAIQLATNSSFSHAGLVFYLPHRDEGIEHTFVIEADQGGVNISNLDVYLRDPLASIGFLRVRHPAFRTNDDLRTAVRSWLLDLVEAGYDYTLIPKILTDLMAATMLGVEGHLVGFERAKNRRTRRNAPLPSQLICSGLVQIGMALGAIGAIKEGEILPHEIINFIMRNDLKTEFSPDWSLYSNTGQKILAEELIIDHEKALRATTPADIACSHHLEWLYLCHHRTTYRVETLGDVEDLLR